MPFLCWRTVLGTREWWGWHTYLEGVVRKSSLPQLTFVQLERTTANDSEGNLLLLQQEKAINHHTWCKCTPHTTGAHWHESQRRKPYGIQGNKPTFVIRNTRRTNWESYKNDRSVDLEINSLKIPMTWDTGLTVYQLQQAIISFNHSVQPGALARSKKVPSWNKESGWPRITQESYLM
jgi:hypothetical protein